jgi:hypothetical protein
VFAVRCIARTAKVTEVKESGGDNFSFELSGCCEEGVQHALKSLS